VTGIALVLARPLRVCFGLHAAIYQIPTEPLLQFRDDPPGASVPVLGTRFIETPEISGVRSIIQAVLFAILFYLGFIRTWKRESTGRSE
jgi:hypothetical protein